MKISYTAQGANAYTVFGDDETGAAPPIIEGFLPRMSGEAQVSPLFRASNAAVFARGNRVWEVRGMIVTTHASADLAAAFIQSQAAAIPDYVDLKIEQGATAIYLTPAVFVGFAPVVSGETSHVEYAFIGGTLTTVAPGA